MAIRAALLLLCLCAAVAVSSARVSPSGGIVRTVKATSTWSLCASKSYAVTIQDVVISPDPVVAGQLATFTIPAIAYEELDGGTVVVTVTFLGFKVHTEKDDLCSKASCPITGEFSLNNAEELPSFTPPGTYKLKFQILDSSGTELTCASISFTIVWKSGFEQLADATSTLAMGMRPIIHL